MNKDLIVRKTIEINASPSKVWQALINPKLISQYFFGTEVITDWRVGSEIIFQGKWQEKEYRDKGKILKFDAEKTLQYSYWSGFSGLEDKEENYSLVTFELQENGGSTVLKLSQQGFASDTAHKHSEISWGTVLEKIKELIEGDE